MEHPGQKHRPKRRRKARRPPPGTSPGTLIADPDAPKPTVRLMAYGPEHFQEHRIEDLQSVKRYLGEFPVTWVNVDGVGDVNTISELGKIFGLHKLAMEDVANVGQRAKVEEYGEHVFIVARMVILTDQLETEQVSLFLGSNFVLTFQEQDGDCLDAVRDRIRKGVGRIRNVGADYLSYALLDAIVDSYFPVLERYGEQLETLEDDVILRPDNDTITRIHAIRRQLLTIRRAIWPKREAINSLLRDSTPLITDDTRVYLRDCYDHAIQIIDLLENYRELASGLMEAYLSSVSNRMNEIMKVLTIFAVIFIPLTFLAGIYGMNFDPDASPWNMPELKWFWGYPAALGMMASVGVGMLALFWWKGWIGSGGSDRK